MESSVDYNWNIEHFTFNPQELESLKNDFFHEYRNNYGDFDWNRFSLFGGDSLEKFKILAKKIFDVLSINSDIELDVIYFDRKENSVKIEFTQSDVNFKMAELDFNSSSS